MSEGIPYLGSKISLISKSEIRYEGILYTIDTNESTVALAKVRSFGTEDRNTDRPVAARDEVYEYIIFRGKDIKDIRVCETPKPQPTLPGGLPNDPAIVQHSVPVANPGYPTADYGRTSYGPVGGTPAYYSAAPVLPPPQQQFVTLSSHSGSRSNTPLSFRKSPTMDQGVQVSGLGGTPKEERRDTRRSSGGSGVNQSQQTTQRQTQTMQQQQPRQPPLSNVNQNKQGGGGRGPPGGRRGRGGPRGGRGGFPKPKEPRLKFDNEYDFEQANAKFQEMETKSIQELETQMAKAKIADAIPNGEEKTEESSTNEAPPAVASTNESEEEVIFYDRSKSFFDNISCEALERSKGKLYRTDWRQERKLNVETFGVTNSYMRRGGYYRGYRGGFRYRGFRGGRGRGGMGGQGGRGGGNPSVSAGNPATNRGGGGGGGNSVPTRKPSNPSWDTKA